MADNNKKPQQIPSFRRQLWQKQQKQQQTTNSGDCHVSSYLHWTFLADEVSSVEIDHLVNERSYQEVYLVPTINNRVVIDNNADMAERYLPAFTVDSTSSTSERLSVINLDV
jgi:hypothetical protein